MSRRNSWLTAIVIGLVVAAAACTRDKRAEQLASLDRGLEAGLLTKAEYDAKKAVILGAGAAPAAAPQSLPTQPPLALPPAAPEPSPLPLAATASPPSIPPAPAAAPPVKSTVGVRRPAASAPPASPPAEPAPTTVPPATPTPPQPLPAQPLSVPPRPSSADDADEEPAPLAGCRDTLARPGKEKGKQERFFPAPVARVKTAAIGALESLEFKVNKDSGREVEAARKRHIGVLVGSGGERMVLRFEDFVQGNQRGTLVTGETKKGFLLRAGQKSWTNAILAQTGCMLARRAAGR